MIYKKAHVRLLFNHLLTKLKIRAGIYQSMEAMEVPKEMQSKCIIQDSSTMTVGISSPK
jgi:hypothetical protein